MPTIEVSHSDLCKLAGKNLSLRELEEKALLFVKGELDGSEGDKLKIDIKDTNRPDLWSVEGVARELRGQYGKEKGIPAYPVKKSGLVVKVDRKLENIRPYTVCAVVRGLNITEEVLSQMIQLQEKIAGTYGRNRKEVAIGVYDFHKIKGPIIFTSVKPNGIKFVPLEFREKLTPKQILEKHPKGKEYAYLLKGKKEYPIFIDSAGEVLSMPPIINSNHTGKVTSSTHDVFIECSGFDLKFLMPALNVLVAALADRGGEIQSVDVEYHDKKVSTPDMNPGTISLDVKYCNAVSGLDLDSSEMCSLLERARYGVKKDRKNLIELSYPAYRQDIMHQRDVVEDVIISYGYNDIEPEPPRIATTGSLGKLETFSERIYNIMSGLGLQGVLNYMLTNKDNNFRKMGLPAAPVVEIDNYVSVNWSTFRTWLLPGVLDLLSKNKHVEYPQKVFELGDVVIPDGALETKTKDVRKLCVAITDTKVGYEEISGMVDALMRNLDVKYALSPYDHESFIKGRSARITIGSRNLGMVGEVSPEVLGNFGIERPVIAFEIDISELMK